MTVDATALASTARMQAPVDRPQSPREAAEQVEALFVKLLLKEVRKSMPEDGLFASRELEMFTDLFDEQVAKDIAESGKLGLADAIEEAITGKPVAHSHRAAHAYRRFASGTASDGPVEGRITSGFGHRHHPILHRRMMHYGVDIGAPRGTPIRAVRDGVVTRSERAGSYGNVVFVDHGNGLETRYAHADELLVRPGARVEAGQVLATVGSTGRSTGPHLHFEVRKDGVAVDPTPFLGAISPSSEIRPQSGPGSDR